MKTKWNIFESEQAREIAMNEAKAAKAEATFTDICERSSLDFPGFGKALKLRDATGFRIFGVKVAAKDTDQLLELSLVGDDLSYLFAKVRELLLSGVVTHISIDIGAGVEVTAHDMSNTTPVNPQTASKSAPQTSEIHPSEPPQSHTQSQPAQETQAGHPQAHQKESPQYGLRLLRDTKPIRVCDLSQDQCVLGSSVSNSSGVVWFAVTTASEDGVLASWANAAGELPAGRD